MSKLQSKNQKNDNNSLNHWLHRIPNLKKGLNICISDNIAPSVIELGIALCSCFVDISIFYANLEFCVSKCTMTRSVFIDFLLNFQS